MPADLLAAATARPAAAPGFCVNQRGPGRSITKIAACTLRGMESRAEPGTLPNLIVIGSQKCGTSGLHHYLGLHPEISMSKPKELDFFITERNYPLGLDWYQGHFDSRAKVRGESSPNYTAFPQHVGVPERMRSIVPEARLLYMVRDPIDRIGAHWVHNFAKRRERGDLSKTLTHRNTSYLSAATTTPSYGSSCASTLASRFCCSSRRSFATGGSRPCAGCSSSSGSTPASRTPSFSDERHRTACKTRATGLAMRLERIRPTGAWVVRTPGLVWRVVDNLFPFRRTIKVPDVREALPPQLFPEFPSRRRRATPRADRARVRHLVDFQV